MYLSLSECAAQAWIKDKSISRAESFDLIRGAGFTHVDVNLADFGENMNATYLRNALKEAGLTPSMSHAPDGYVLRNDPEKVVKVYTDTFRFCAEAGFPITVLHPIARPGNTREEFFDMNKRVIDRLIPVIEETGVTAALENIGNYADPIYLWNGNDLRYYINLFSHPQIKACWDVGHANHFKIEDNEQYSSVTTLGDKLCCLHVHDNCGYFEDSYLHHRIDMHMSPFASCKTSVNYDALMQGLKDINYTGTFNFEVAGFADSMRAPFVYNGQVVTRLEKLPVKIWQMYMAALYETGKYMLETYDMFEG